MAWIGCTMWYWL